MSETATTHVGQMASEARYVLKPALGRCIAAEFVWLVLAALLVVAGVGTYPGNHVEGLFFSAVGILALPALTAHAIVLQITADTCGITKTYLLGTVFVPLQQVTGIEFPPGLMRGSQRLRVVTMAGTAGFTTGANLFDRDRVTGFVQAVSSLRGLA